MKLEAFTEFLTKQAGARKDGPAYVVPSDTEVAVFVGLSGETLTLTRVHRLEIAGDLVVAETARGEKVAVALEDVRAVRTEKSTAAASRGAGFGK